jgi:hypothetical protein
MLKQVLAAAACCLLVAFASACGGDSASNGGTATAAKTEAARTASARPTTGATSPAGGATAPAGGDAQPTAATSDTSVAGDEGGATPIAGDDATAVSGGPGGITGGATDTPRQAVSTIPPPPAGKTPAVDPTTIADPGGAPASGGDGSGGGAPDPNALQLAVDLDAATPGIQSTRDIAPGDVIRAAIVILNVPAGPGISAFNFELDYDRTKVAAPTYAGGAASDRNPDLNEAGVGDGWTCLPAPQGDLDDEGGIEGDADPATGQAFLSCFAADGAATGNVVLATIELHGIGSGATSLDLTHVNVGVGDGIEIARCADSDEHVVPCTAARVTVG